MQRGTKEQLAGPEEPTDKCTAGAVERNALAGSCFFEADPEWPCSAIVAQSSPITACPARAGDNAIDRATDIVCAPDPKREAKLVRRTRNLRRATTCMQTA
jgi:hypothetical protein